jgi:hypothetical protein
MNTRASLPPGTPSAAGEPHSTPNPVLIAVAAVVGLVAYPLLQPQWVMVR